MENMDGPNDIIAETTDSSLNVLIPAFLLGVNFLCHIWLKVITRGYLLYDLREHVQYDPLCTFSVFHLDRELLMTDPVIVAHYRSY